MCEVGNSISGNWTKTCVNAGQTWRSNAKILEKFANRVANFIQLDFVTVNRR